MPAALPKRPRHRAFHRPFLLAGFALAPVAAAFAQTSASYGNVQDVVVTTGVRGEQRTVADSPAPIDVINADQLVRTGRAELSEAISKLLPSVNFGSNQAGVNSIVRPITNRGLGPAYTLVLVNGKRRHNGSLLTNGGGDTSGVNAVDIDLIPVSAVDHIEVLKDSAAAQYGSDAVAGVINIVLKNGAAGGHVGVSYGELYNTQGDEAATRAEADYGLALGEDGFLHLSADARQRGMAWWNFPATNRTIYSPASDPRNAAWNGDGAHNGDPEIKAGNFAFNAELPIDATLRTYAFGTVGKRYTQMGNNFRRPNGTASFSSLFPNGYYPLNNSGETDYQLVAGARGLAAGWNWDASSSFGRNRVRQYSDLTINPSLGPTSPTSFGNLATYQFDQFTNNLDITRAFDLGLKKPVQVSAGAEYRVDRFRTFAGDPLGSRIGGYVIQPGDQDGNPNVGKLASIGAQGAVVLSPADEANLRRGVFAAYTDVGFNPTDRWFVDVAARGEHYDDASGNTVSGKLNSRFELTPEVALRGTVGTGFRAPSLTQIGYAQTDNRTNLDVNGNVVPSLSKVLRNNSELAHALGAQDLKPEKSRNAGLGVAWTPVRGTNVTLDGYRVDIKDRIVRTGYLYGPAFSPLLQNYGLSGTEWVQYFANAVDTRTTGLDLVADTTQDYGRLGTVRWNVGFNYNETEITRIRATPSQITALGANAGGNNVWFGRSAQGDLTVANPHNKLILGARWFIDAFDVNLQTTRYGSYKWQRTENKAQDIDFGARWITDLDVTYAFKGGVKVSVGATNLFNIHPEKAGYVDANTGAAAFVYGPSPFHPGGGFWYSKLAYDF
ncbi:TonB-dependent receptor plug domain-containing protein [Derxia gummosa]|uniref:TonB-dependent receptor plug domain-containing protein n=1 Tax=Derxia gummosa DSM 723 TaxID=1121388 RepID=A0A8B6X3Z7_9BURK|nr:TonB-dependent receptor [Derxia gummosa]